MALNKVGKIKLKNLDELVDKSINVDELKKETNIEKQQTPVKEEKPRRRRPVAGAAGTVIIPKKTKLQSTNAHTSVGKKQVPPNQLRIDSFFKSSSKSYYISPTVSAVNKENLTTARNGKINKPAAITIAAVKPKSRKRLFEDTTETDTDTTSNLSCFTTAEAPKTKGKTKSKIPVKVKVKAKAHPSPKQVTEKELSVVPEIIDLCSDEEDLTATTVTTADVKPTISSTKRKSKEAIKPNVLSGNTMVAINVPETIKIPLITKPIISLPKHSPETSLSSRTSSIKTVAGRVKKPRPLPSYKVIAETSFAVDAFQFGQISGVTHYFLTHFHADHYVGLTAKFAMPLYMSPITARLVRAFISVDVKYIHEIELNQSIMLADVEVTAIEANHCPGAIMLMFKVPSGKCILHTGDFRASTDMESEPIFWNNDIDTIYLDTTYLSNKYAFRTQCESIDCGVELLQEFSKRHMGKRILYVCGSYLIGKEKFWSALVHEFSLKVWAEPNRRKALRAMQLPELPEKLFCDNQYEANLHVIGMGKLSYLSLVEYFEPLETHYDLLLAIRPSGWEKNSRPQYRGKINIVGVEYSEHSSYNELQRFVSYLKPQNVISTVPVGRDATKTCIIPVKWYKYEKLMYGLQRNFQPSITCYLKVVGKNTTKSELSSHTAVKCFESIKSTLKHVKNETMRNEVAYERMRFAFAGYPLDVIVKQIPTPQICLLPQTLSKPVSLPVTTPIVARVTRSKTSKEHLRKHIPSIENKTPKPNAKNSKSNAYALRTITAGKVVGKSDADDDWLS